MKSTDIRDEFAWLEQPHTKRAQAWIEREDAAARKALAGMPARERIKRRLQRLYRHTRYQAPVVRNGWYFHEKKDPSDELPLLYVQKGLRGKPRVLINPNKLSKDASVTLEAWRPSQDGALLLYALSQAGNDKKSLHVLDVRTGKLVEDAVSDAIYPLDAGDWAADNSGFWYSRGLVKPPKGEEKLHRRLYFHKLGDAYQKDRLVFGEGLPKEDMLSSQLSANRQYLLVERMVLSEEEFRSELYLCDLAQPDVFVPIIQGKRVSASGFFHRDQLYIVTNEGAPRSKAQRIALADAMRGKKPRTIIPEAKHVLAGVTAVGDTLLSVYFENAADRVYTHALDGSATRPLRLPAFSSIGFGDVEEESVEAFIILASFATPRTIYRYEVRTRKLAVFKRNSVPLPAVEFVAKQEWCTSKDGTKVPMFIVHKKGVRRNGANPTVMLGYGGFDVPLTPFFMLRQMPFLEAGGVFVVANLRGGGEFGKAWHDAGRRNNKQNVFNDFIAAAEHLIQRTYTKPERLGIMGGSNGGLLTSAVMLQRPDLFGAVASIVPVTDMLRFHKFGGGALWVPEYGNPDIPKERKWMLRYSPYHNVKDGTAYPPLLIKTSDHDDRVHPMHSYKFAARMCQANPENTVLVRVERQAGHSGGAAQSKEIEEQADMLAFFFTYLDVGE
ncbi:MAG: prolyl oligopeptidase family serine peptidase [Candidatus Spechtbacterales bacterium]